MINSIATYKESLSRIANEVFDAAEELEVPPPRDGSRENSPASARRFSQRSSRFTSPMAGSPIANGIGADHGSNDEEQLSKLREENGSLKKSIDASRDQSPKSLSNNSKEYKSSFDEAGSLAVLQATHESEIKQLKAQLDSERENASTVQLKLQEESQLKESSQRELQNLKIEKERTFTEMKELQKELREKMTQLRQLQVELSRRNMEEDLNESLENLKNKISILEEENAKLKAEKSEFEANLKLRMKSALESTCANGLGSLDRNASKLNEKAIEEMELSMRKLRKTLEHASKERDKALQELDRLKQHLLDKSN